MFQRSGAIARVTGGLDRFMQSELACLCICVTRLDPPEMVTQTQRQRAVTDIMTPQAREVKQSADAQRGDTRPASEHACSARACCHSTGTAAWCGRSGTQALAGLQEHRRCKAVCRVPCRTATSQRLCSAIDALYQPLGQGNMLPEHIYTHATGWCPAELHPAKAHYSSGHGHLMIRVALKAARCLKGLRQPAADCWHLAAHHWSCASLTGMQLAQCQHYKQYAAGHLRT